MRALSKLEFRGLVSMVYNSGYELQDGDGMEEALGACVERGLAVLSEDEDWETWEPTELGLLALRVHVAASGAA